jgi:DNA invertase Pin-like site-specific DNA recombinase
MPTDDAAGTMTGVPARPYPRAMTLAELRRLMRAAGIATQTALARELNVHKVTVWRWFNKPESVINAPMAALIRQTLKARTD